ncbi:hypothetical protein MNBD_GAMMA10-1936 [hydrothermal vent metagenome]|uniref:Uncharacterized protein n=1 Tax=hydrothermal vent metagenome TaxID=652676 RepID=A0A3B0YFC4_9ZZZZ
MDKNDIAWLAKQNEPLAFIVTPVTGRNALHLQICHDHKTTPMTTTLGIIREFRSLDPIARLIYDELGLSFEVRDIRIHRLADSKKTPEQGQPGVLRGVSFQNKQLLI